MPKSVGHGDQSAGVGGGRHAPFREGPPGTPVPKAAGSQDQQQCIGEVSSEHPSANETAGARRERK